MANLNSSNKKWASMSDNQKKDIQDALSRIRGGNGNETPQQALQRIASQGSYTPRSAFELTANPYTGEVYDGNKILNDYITKVRQANQIQRDYERSVKQLAMNELRMAAQEPLGDRNNPDLYQSRTRYSAKPRAAQQSAFDPSKVKIDPAQIAEFAKTQRIGNTAPKQYDFSNVDYKDWINSGESISSRTPEEMMRFDNTGVRQQSVAEKARELLRSVGRGSSNPYASTYQFGDGIQTRRTGSGGNTFMNQRMSDASEKYERAYMDADRNQRSASIEAAIRDPNNPLNLAEQFLANNPVEETGFTGKYKEYEAYAQMTNEQKAVYNYIYATYGPQQAEEYKDGLMDMLNARVGQEIYDTQIRDANPFEKALASYSQGVNSGLEGIANAPAALLGIDNRHATSPEEYAASYLRSDPNNSGVERVLYDLASSTGNMTPGIVASYLGAPQLVGSAMFGASQAGNAYNQALQNGNSVSQASAYAMQQFVDEELTNYLLGGVNAFGGGLVQRYIGAGPVGQAINNAINRVAKTESGRRILRSVAQMLGDAAGEAQQEYLQFFTDNFTQALLGMRDENGDIVQMNTNLADPDALYSAALGALNALFLNMPNTATRMLNGRNADVSNARELADSLKDISADDFTGKESFKQAQEVQRIAEEIAEKQEAGETVTAAERIAFNEAMNDMVSIGNETDEESGEEKVDETETNYWTEKEAAEAEKNQKAALKAFEQAENVRLPQEVADQMINSYTEIPVNVRGNASQYMQAYKRMYVAGEHGVDFETAMRSPLARTYLNADQLHQAYAAGVARANIDNGVQLKQGKARHGGLTYADKNATAAQKKIATWAGNKTGFSVEIRSDIKGGAEIDLEKGILRLNPLSDNFLQSLAHELTHLIRQFDAEGYKKFSDIAIQAAMESRNMSHDQLYALYESKYGETGTTPNVDDVIEEMVADSAGQFLNDEEFINKIVQEDRSLAEKIIDFFRGVVEALRESMSQENLRPMAKALKEKEARYSKALDTWTAALDRASENSRNGMVVDEESGGTKYEVKTNSYGEKYWNVETGDDIFKGIKKTSELKKAAYDWILHGEKGESVKELIDGEELVFTRIGAGEYVYGRQSKGLSPDVLNDKMRIAPSVVALIENANTEWHSKDMKNHKIASDGWQNYRGKVRLDNTMFDYIVRVAQGNKGNQFYDINLEVDAKVPGTKSVSHKNSSTSKERLSLSDVVVKKQLDMSEPIEKTKNLIAIRNVDTGNIMSMLNLEGLPSPSIAITKDSIGHTAFGDISFIFGKDTIDPKANKKNLVFDADAWTPLYPGIEYDYDKQKIHKEYDALRGLKNNGKLSDYYADRANAFLNRIEFGNSSSFEQIIDDAKTNYGMKQYFLATKGESVPIVENTTETKLTDDQVSLSKRIIDAIGEDRLNDGLLGHPDLRDDIQSVIRDHYINEYGFTEQEADNAVRNMDRKEIVKAYKDVKSYMKNGDTTTTTTQDYNATEQAINEKIDDAEYEAWLRKQLDGIVKDQGIRNDKNYYTNSGMPRSFKQLHYTVNAENIVKAMWAGREQGAVAFSGMTAKSVRGAAARKYKSIDEMHQNADRLQNVSDGALFSNQEEQLLEESNVRLLNVKTEVFNDNNIQFKDTDRYVFYEKDYTEALLDVASKGLNESKTKAKFAEYGVDITDAQAKEICDIIDNLRNLPTDYFEAKPKRVVGWDEIGLALVPDNTDQAIVDRMREVGIENIQTYPAGDNDARLKMEQSADHLKFQLNIEDMSEDDITGQLSLVMPDQNNRQKDLAKKAMIDLKKITSANGRAVTTGMGITVSSDLLQRGKTSLIGKNVQTPQQLAEIAQVYIDPRFETLRYFFTDKDGNIVFQTGVTSTLPSASAINDFDTAQSDYFKRLAIRASGLGATNVYQMHNHPSGSPVPSSADVSVSKHVASIFQDRYGINYGGHVVLDGDEYTVLSPYGDFETYKFKNVDKNVQKAFKPGIKNSLVGRKLLSPSDIASVANSLKMAQDSDQYSVLLFTDTQGKLRVIQECENSLLNDEIAFKQHAHDISVNYGCYGVSVVTKNGDDFNGIVKNLFVDGTLTDGVLLKENSYESAYQLFSHERDDTGAEFARMVRNDQTNTVEHFGQIHKAKRVGTTNELRFQLGFDEDTGFESEAMFNDNQDIQSASDTLGKILSEIDEMPSKKVIADTAYMLRKTTNTNVGVDQIKEHLTSIFEYLAFNRNIDGADISHIAADFVGTLYDDGKATINPIDKEVYDEFRDKLRTYTFHMPPGFDGEIKKLGGIGALRREFFGTMNITKEKGIPIDTMWDELCGLYPEYFDKDIVNPADQLEHLVDTIRALKPQPTTDELSGDDYDVMRYSVGQDVLKAFVQNGKNAEMREQYEKKLEKGLQRAKDKAKQQKERARLKKLDRQARKNLLTKAQTLAKMKGGPQFEQAKEDLIGDLDIIAVGLRKDTRAKLESLQQHAMDLAARDEDYKELYFDRAQEVFSRLQKKHIKDMTGQEVQELTDKIVELIYQEREYKRLINEQQGVMVATVGRRAMAQQAYAKGINEKNIIGATLGRIGLNMLNPTRAFQAIDGYQPGGVFTTFGKQLNDGQTRMNTFVMNANKKFNSFLDEHEDLVKTWSKADIDTGFKDDNGKPVMISKGMRVSLYLHSLNKQNETHIAEAGIKIPNADLYNKGKYEAAYRSGDANHTGYSTTVKISTTQLKSIVADMTDDEKAFADLAYDFLNTDTKNAINEVSLMLNGTYKANVENYFPIKADSNFTMGDITGLVKDATIEGMGMLKERQKGVSVPILLEDVAQVLQRQITNTGRYYGLAIPVRDFNRIMKFNESAGKRISVRNSIESTWGKVGTQYITDVISHLQAGTPAENGPGADIFNRLKGTYAGTVLNWNLGVAIKQSASAPFAAVVLDAKSVARAMATKAFKKAEYDYMDSITPWSYMRRQGMSGTEMGEVYRQKNPVENSRAWNKLKQKLNWIQNVDVWTTDRLFFATEYYVQDHFPDLEVRGTAYNKKVAELYNDMLQRTQPSYDVMQRNAYLRSGNALTKIAGMFKTQTFNMGGEVLDAWGKLQASKKLLKDGRISEDQAKAIKAQFGRTIAATAVSQMMLTMLGIIAKAVMHNMKNYRDDKGEVTAEQVVSRGIYDFITSFAGMMIGGSEVQSIGLALTGKEKWYDLEYPGLAVINDLIASGVNMSKSLRKAIENGWDSEDVDAFKKNAIKFAMNGAIVGRIPANNIYNLGNAMHLWYQDWKNGKLWTWDAGESLFGIKDSGVTKEQYAKQAISAMQAGDEGKAEYAMQNTNKEKIEAALGAESSKDENDNTIKNSKKADALKKIDEMDAETSVKVKLAKETYGLDGLTEDNWSEAVKVYEAMVNGKQPGVIEYFESSDLSEDEKHDLWINVCGYSEKTFSKVTGVKETEAETEPETEPETVPETEPETETEAKTEIEAPKVEASANAASEIESEIVEGGIESDARYAYIVDSIQNGKHTAEEAVAWYNSDQKRVNAAKYQSWLNAGGTTFDYIKTRSDLSKFKGDGKQERIANYIQNQGYSEAKQRVIWFDIMDYSEKKWNKYFGVTRSGPGGATEEYDSGDLPDSAFNFPEPAFPNEPEWDETISTSAEATDTEEDMPDYWYAHHEYNLATGEWEAKQLKRSREKKVTGTGTVKKGNPVTWDDGEESWPIGSDPFGAAHVAMAKADTTDKRLDIYKKYLDSNNIHLTAADLTKHYDLGTQSAFRRLMFDTLPYHEKRDYIYENWAVDPETASKLENNELTDDELVEFIDDNWEKNESDLLRLARKMRR